MCTESEVCYLYVQDYFKINLEFDKLEKIQFGGSKGKCLVEMVAQVYTEFTELVKIFTNSTYDPMELTAKVNRWPATVVQGIQGWCQILVKLWGSDCTSKLIDV